MAAVGAEDRDPHRARGHRLEREPAQASVWLSRTASSVVSWTVHSPGGISWPTMRRAPSSTTITSISTPGARKVSCRAVSSLRTPVSSVAESKTSSASSSLICATSSGAGAIDHLVGDGFRGTQGAAQELLQFVVGHTHGSPAFGSRPGGRSLRSRSRQRARVGPMLPIGRPISSEIVS